MLRDDLAVFGQALNDLDPQTGIAPGVRWKSELVRAVDRCEAVSWPTSFSAARELTT